MNTNYFAMQEDKKADPEILNKLINNRAEIEEKKSRVMINGAKFRLEVSIPLSHFKADENFDAIAFYASAQQRKKELITGAK